MSQSPRVVALLTDFGHQDHYVGTMKGVILSGNPKTRIIDISHEVHPQQVRQAAYLLWASYKFFPPETVFVCVVDPGVGSKRRIIAARAGNFLFLAPDNGILDVVISGEELHEAVQVYPVPENSGRRKFFPQNISSTFHGRDIFAPVAAMLAAGKSLKQLGSPVRLEPRSLPFTDLSGNSTFAHVLHIDRFGNVVTNIQLTRPSQNLQWFPSLRVGKKVISTWIRFYDEAPPGRPCLIVGSSNLVEISVKNGSAAVALSIDFDTKFRIVRK